MQTEMKADETDKCLCFSKSPHQLVVIGSEKVEKWTMNEESVLSLTRSFDLPVNKTSRFQQPIVLLLGELIAVAQPDFCFTTPSRSLFPLSHLLSLPSPPYHYPPLPWSPTT